MLLPATFIYAVVLRLGIFLQPSASDDAIWINPLSELLHRIISLSNYSIFIQHTLSILLVFVMALILSNLINIYRLTDRAGYLPALLFILCASFFNEFCRLTPALCGSFFLLFAFTTLVRMYKAEKAGGPMFNAGFFIGLSALFYLPYLSFVVFLLGGYILSRPLNIREIITGLLGIIIPFYFAGVVYFLNDSFTGYLKSLIAIYDIETIQQAPDAFIAPALKLSALLFLFLIASFHSRGKYNKMVMQNRVILTLTFVFFFSGICSTLFIQDNGLSHFMWLPLPFTVILSIFMAELRKPWMAEILHLCLLLLVFYFQYLH